jgi:imidazolonepropionase-like amidohydrolase
MRQTLIATTLLAAVVVLIHARGPHPAAQAAGPEPIALVGGTLIDGTSRGLVLNSVVLVRGERIEKVGTTSSLRVPPDYRQVSTEGMTVLPGLWDAHTHLQYSAHADLAYWNATYQPQMERVIMPAIAEQLLMAGVTSARDLMAPTDAILNVKKRIASGAIPGPTLYVSGALLEHQPPAGLESFRWPVSGAEDGRAKIAELSRRGVDIIKLLCVPQMSIAEATAVVAEAHARGLKVAAHGRSDDEVRKCLAAGVDDFQHLSPDAVFPDDIMTAIRERVRRGPPLVWTPTVGELYSWESMKTNPEILDDPAWQRGLPPNIVDDVKRSMASFPAALAKRTPLNSAVLKKKFEQLRDAGAVMLVGTDSGAGGHFHPQSVWLELDAWTGPLSVDPMTAIRAATYLPAEVMGVVRDYGTVEAGKFADLIIVHGDPLRHVNILRDPVAVIKHGRRYK